MGKTIPRRFMRTWIGKIPNWECMFVHRKQGLLLSVYVDDINMAGQKQDMAPMWKKYMKKTLMLRKQHHVLIMKTWDVFNVNANQMKQLFNEKQRCLNHVFLLEQLKNYRDGTNLKQKQ